MVKHIVLWKLKEELSKEEKDKVKKEIKEGLLGLKGKLMYCLIRYLKMKRHLKPMLLILTM